MAAGADCAPLLTHAATCTANVPTTRMKCSSLVHVHQIITAYHHNDHCPAGSVWCREGCKDLDFAEKS